MSSVATRAAQAPVVAQEGRITRSGVLLLQQRIREALGTGHPKVVVDLRGAEFENPSTVSLFYAALCRLSRDGARLSVVGLSPHLRRVLEICRYEGVEHHPTLAAARAGPRPFPQ